MPKPSVYNVRGVTAYMFRIKRPDTGKRGKIRLGAVSLAYAQEVGLHIDRIIEAIKYQTDYPPKTLSWLSSIPEDLYQRFANVGLVGSRSTSSIPTLGDFLVEYTRLKSLGSSRRGGWKPNTVKNRKQSMDDMLLYYGSQTTLDEINAASPEEWLCWMIEPKPDGRGLAPASASKKLKDARQFFEFARRKQYIVINPFEGVRLPPQDNPERLVYVSRLSIENVLAEIEDPEFRLLIALGRYTGFRIPSEAKGLRWGDINWLAKTIRVTAAKKESNSVGGQRICKLFDELMPFLKAIEGPGMDRGAFVMPKLRLASGDNFRTQFGRYIDRAGVERWPRLFQNLRASALTDLAEKYPLPWVCKWLGNSVDVAMRHYMMLKGVDLADTSLGFAPPVLPAGDIKRTGR